MACVLFFVAIFTEFSVRLYYASTNPLVQAISGLLAIIFLTFLLLVIFFLIPNLRKAFFRVLGIEE